MINIDSFANVSFQRALRCFGIIFRQNIFAKDEDAEKKVAAQFQSFINPKIFSTFFTQNARGVLYLYLVSMKAILKQKNEVLGVGFTCVAVCNSITAAGYRCVLFDLEPDTFSLDGQVLGAYIKDHHQQIAFVLLQWTFGMCPRDRNHILHLCQKYNISIIEDLAHGFDPKKLKSCNFVKNQVLLFSFGRSKFLSAGMGGMLISFGKIPQLPTRSRINKKKVMQLIALEIFGPIIKSTYTWGLGKLFHKLMLKANFIYAEVSPSESRGEFEIQSTNYLPKICLLLVIDALESIDNLITTQNQITASYDRAFGMNYQSNIRSHYPLLVSDPKTAKIYLAKNNVFLSSWYSQNIAGVNDAFDKHGVVLENMVRANGICKKIISLPVNEMLGPREMEYLKTMI